MSAALLAQATAPESARLEASATPLLTHAPRTHCVASSMLLAALAPLAFLLPVLGAYATPFQTDVDALLGPLDVGGRPLARALLALCSLVPLGPLPLRAQLAAVLALVAIAVALCAALDGALRAAGVRDGQLRVSLATGVAWTACGALLFSLSRLDGLAEHGPALALTLACLAQRMRLFAEPRVRASSRYARLALTGALLLVEQPLLAAIAALLVGSSAWRTGRAVLRTTFSPAHASTRSTPPPASVPPAAPRGAVRALVALCALALGAFSVHAGAARIGGNRSPAPDVLADMLVRSAPNAAVVLAPAYVTQAVQRVQREDGSRPDLVVLPLHALRDPSRAEDLAHRHPELAGVIRAALLHETLDAAELQSLATQRPVRVLPPLAALAPLHEVLTPAAFGAEISSSVVIGGDLHAAAAATVRTSLDAQRFEELSTATLDAEARRALREHYVIQAALLAPLARGTLLSESVQRAALFAQSAEEREQLTADMLQAGMPAAVLEPAK